MSLPNNSNKPSAVTKGTRAAADALAKKLHWLADDDRALELARAAIDAWLLGSNPVGEPETIYDEYTRLRTAARAVLAHYDATPKQWGEPSSAPMERLRYVLTTKELR